MLSLEGSRMRARPFSFRRNWPSRVRIMTRQPAAVVLVSGGLDSMISAASAREAGYRLAVGREPSAEEQKELAAFLAEQRASYKGEKRPDAAALALVDFCQVLLGLNEFVYVD